MKVLLLGSGFVAGPCLSVLLERNDIVVSVAARTEASVKKLIQNRKNAVPLLLDVTNRNQLEDAISTHDLIISLIPYTFHVSVIKAAIKFKKHVVTTSYISPEMAALDDEAKAAGITVFNEIGVDPGIDHLYAIEIIDKVHAKKGLIKSFTSYCGGLPAPESSNNPLGYKFSWSSRGVLLALRNSAKFYQDGKIEEVSGSKLMESAKNIQIYPAFALTCYPNRDSTVYTKRYNIPECETLVRGTLRYQCFPKFIQCLGRIGFLSDKPEEYLKPGGTPITWRHLMALTLGLDPNTDNHILEVTILEKTGIPSSDKEVLSGLKWLGLLSETPIHPRSTLLDTLCATLEDKMMYAPGERDMVILQHKFQILYPETGKTETRTSTGLWYGVPHGDSAMATTVGVPCAVTALLILDGKITKRGVVAPMTRDVNSLIVNEIEKRGIRMVEEVFEFN